MTQTGPKVVELVRHRYRGHCHPGTEAGSQSETQVPKPMWDRGTETSQSDQDFSCGPEGSRTPDPTRARGVLYQLSYWP
jgi:hypothetical protein